MPVTWNPWHGCQKISPGCANCYVFQMDAKHGKDGSQLNKNTMYDLPLRRNRSQEYKIPPGELVYTCFTSDFLLEEADPWRAEVWEMMRLRDDLRFLFLTKRIHRLAQCVPSDWGSGYPNVHICCTAENQAMADLRLPIFLQTPISQRGIVCEPLLGPVNLAPYLGSHISQVLVGGESGGSARICDYHWVLDIRSQCLNAGVPFYFKQTGSKLLKNGRLYQIQRKDQHTQARKANINHMGKPIPSVDYRPFG